MKNVVLVGASGLIGRELLKLLLENENIKQVQALVRTVLPITNVKLIQVKTDFESLEEYSDKITGDVLYCCIGTTKSKTPNQQDYRRIDYDYPLQLAKIASANNISQFHLISALGADSGSRIFYNKVKGDIERAVSSVEIKSIHIYQPSFLTGDRIEKRPFEKMAIHLMKFIDPLLLGSLKKYKSIPAKTIAKTMINQTFKNMEGIFKYPSDIIKQLA